MQKKSVQFVLFSLWCLTSMGVSASNFHSLTGPTLSLGYSNSGFQINRIDDFMYFIPLISETSVTTKISRNMNLSASLVSWDMDKNGRNFEVQCQFEVTGQGFHKTTFDHEEMIGKILARKPKINKMCNVLESIELQGACVGLIRTSGQFINGQAVVDEVKVSFNHKKNKSPVMISLYNISKRNGRFDYKNRTHNTKVRVNSLIFKETEDQPLMNAEIASVVSENGKEGFFSCFKAVFANMLLDPQPIASRGNDAMINFGQALVERNPSFTFPYADNLHRIVTQKILSPTTQLAIID